MRDLRRYWRACFNPCFNGLSYLTPLAIGPLAGAWVSTLVLMDCHIWHGIRRLVGDGQVVSTLVLMDCHIWPDRLEWYQSAMWCFNPCFNGLSYLTNEVREAVKRHLVSTLVLMDCHIWPSLHCPIAMGLRVSTLVLMDCHIWPRAWRQWSSRSGVSTLVLMDCHIWHPRSDG